MSSGPPEILLKTVTWKQEPGGRHRCKNNGIMLFTDLLIVTWPAWFFFFVYMSTICTDGPLPKTGWTLLHQWLIKQLYYRLTHSLILWKHLLIWGFHFLDDTSLCIVGKNCVCVTYVYIQKLWKSSICCYIALTLS